MTLACAGSGGSSGGPSGTDAATTNGQETIACTKKGACAELTCNAATIAVGAQGCTGSNSVLTATCMLTPRSGCCRSPGGAPAAVTCDFGAVDGANQAKRCQAAGGTWTPN